jgi:hypothetical protein
MNDPWNLSIYAQMVRFQVDQTENDLLIRSSDNSKHQAAYLLARGLGLECEYYLDPNTVRITRSILSMASLPNLDPSISAIAGLNLPAGNLSSLAEDAYQGLTGPPLTTAHSELATHGLRPIVQTDSMTNAELCNLKQTGEDFLSGFDFDYFINDSDQEKLEHDTTKKISEFPNVIMSRQPNPELANEAFTFPPQDIVNIPIESVPNVVGLDTNGAAPGETISWTREHDLGDTNQEDADDSFFITKETPVSMIYRWPGSEWSDWAWSQGIKQWWRARANAEGKLLTPYPLPAISLL